MDQAAAQPRKCPGLECGNDASTLQCPKCKDMGVESFFCSQECFKRSWVGNLGLCKTCLCQQSAILTEVYRESIKRFIRVRTHCAILLPQVLCLRSIQNPGTSIPSLHIHIPVPLDRSTRFPRSARFRNPYLTLSGHSRAFRTTHM